MFADTKQAEQARIAWQMECQQKSDELRMLISRKMHDFARLNRDPQYIYIGFQEMSILNSSPYVEMRFSDPKTKPALRLYGIELIEVIKDSFLEIG